MRVTVMGLGYVGLPLASVLATSSFEVLGVDVNPYIVDLVNKGKVHIEEPGIKTVVEAAVRSGKLKASREPQEADVFILAVQTPLDLETKKADLSYLKGAAERIVPYLRKGNLVIVESTIPPRTTKNVVKPILEKSGLKVGEEVYLAHCPERLLPGNTLYELVHNDRIIGGVNRESAEKAAEFYRKFVKGNLYLTDSTTAEVAKLMENTFRDVNIALANEFALICEEYGVNVWEAIALANKHPRVNIHRPGAGVGGHCLPKDPWLLLQGYSGARLIPTARDINEEMPRVVVSQIEEMVRGIEKPKVVVLGVAYKGNTDDPRNSPAEKIIGLLEKKGYRWCAYDPHVRNFSYELSPLESCLRDADIVVLVTDHQEFRYLDPESLGRLMRHRMILDTRNVLDHEKWREAGFRVKVLGDGRDRYSSRH